MNIEQLIDDPQTLVVCSHSGGKDSQAMYLFLRNIVPADRMVVIHAHLPEVEWPGIEEHIEATTTHKLHTVVAVKTFFEMVEHRGMFPSPQYRQCTSDLKRGPIRKEIKRICNKHGYNKVLDCMGLRAEESAQRAKQKEFTRVKGECNSKRDWYRWLPIHTWTEDAVFDYIRSNGQEPHWAYGAGMSRLSCCFCIMSSRKDLATAAKLRPQLFQRYVETERRIGHAMMMPGEDGPKNLDEIVADYEATQEDDEPQEQLCLFNETNSDDHAKPDRRAVQVLVRRAHPHLPFPHCGGFDQALQERRPVPDGKQPRAERLPPGQRHGPDKRTAGGHPPNAAPADPRRRTLRSISFNSLTTTTGHGPEQNTFKMLTANMPQTTTTFKNKTIDQTVQTLRELETRQLDITTSLHKVHMNDSGKVVLHGVQMENGSRQQIVTSISDNGHRHIAAKVGIPYKYWLKTFHEMPDLAAYQFNRWADWEYNQKGADKTRNVFLRTYMDEPGGNIGTLRAMLSGNYFVVDNLPTIITTLNAVKEITQEQGLNIRVNRCDLSENKLYMRFTCPDIEEESRDALRNYRDPNNGDTGGLGTSNGIVSGFTISNSEVGAGRFTVAPRIKVLACNNGMIWAEEAYNRIHLGSKMEEGVYQQDTYRTNLELIRKQLRDHVTKFLNPEFLGQRVKDIEAMAARKLENPVQCVRNMVKETGFTDEQLDGILNHFVSQGDGSSVFSVAQAFTSYAQLEDPDSRYALESAATGLLAIANKCDKPAEK